MTTEDWGSAAASKRAHLQREDKDPRKRPDKTPLRFPPVGLKVLSVCVDAHTVRGRQAYFSGVTTCGLLMMRQQFQGLHLSPTYLHCSQIGMDGIPMSKMKVNVKTWTND